MKPSIDQLWNALRPNEREQACQAFAKNLDDELKARICRTLAVALRFREKTLQTMSPERLGTQIAIRIKQPFLSAYRDDAIKAWLIAHHRPLLERFVSALGVEHDHGLITTDVPPPSVESFQTALCSMPGDSKRVVALYLGYLLAFGDGLWANLAPAMEAEGRDLTEMLVSDDPMQALGEPQASPLPQDEAAAQAEDNQAFTTLDNLLIVTAVASAFGQLGALSADQTTDLIEEVVELNSGRPRSLFHRGFMHALFDRDFNFHFPGENAERRLWYACGVMFGLLRRHDSDRCIKILDDNPDLAEGLAMTTAVPCGSMLLKHLFSPLLNAGKVTLLTRWMKKQIPRVAPEDALELLANAHYRGASMFRRGNVAEADLLFEIVEQYLPEVPIEVDEEEESPVLSIMADNSRKRAQVLQLQGDFQRAAQRLDELLKIDTLNAHSVPAMLCDLGLIEGGFRSIASVLPGPDEGHVEALVEALGKGRDRFAAAIEKHGRDATNAHFCLGILSLLQGGLDGASTAGNHFSTALSGMLRREKAYESSGMIDWTRFALGVALLESLEPANFPQASDSIDHALKSPMIFPLWLWRRALVSAGMFADKSLVESIAARLLATRGDATLESLLASNASDASPELRESILQMLEQSSMPVRDQWNHLKAMLPGALKDDNQQAERILDSLERLAVDNREFSSSWCALMANSQHYSPAWRSEDAERSLLRMHELIGDFECARQLLRQLFYRLRESAEDHHLLEAEIVLDDLKNLPNPCEDLDCLRQSLDQLKDDHAQGEAAHEALLNGCVVRVLYVGGNETQAQYVDAILREVCEEYPGVTIEFDFPGWSSTWNRDLARVKGKLPQNDVVVINTLVRTQFGRGLRAACGSSSPWLPCTGRGCAALTNSIKKAALFAAKRAAISR